MTLSTQASAIETARSILMGGTKAPKVGGNQCLYLAAELDRAAETVRNLDKEKSHAAPDARS